MKGKPWICLAGLLAGLLTGVLFAGEFAAPAEGPVAFRRDRIPLDADAMAVLSNYLERMARATGGETPAERRGAAQMLALALALDPGNSGARNLIPEFQEGRHIAEGEQDRLETSRAGIWQSIGWLETPDAGADGQALAACLKDVMLVSDPGHPKADALRAAGEQGAWAGWVPDLSSYGEKKLVSNHPPRPRVVPAAKPLEEGRVLLETAEVRTPLWMSAGEGDSRNWVLACAPLQMSAKRVQNDEGGEPPFSIRIGNREDLQALGKIGGKLESLLASQYGSLPKGVRVKITSRAFERSLLSKKLQSISAASAVLASAAVTGREPDAIIIGQIDENGAFTLPKRFWYQLQSLGKGTGQRLVLPVGAEAYLPSMLAMEKPEFFFDYDVLLASDFKELLNLTAKTPEEPLASAIVGFQEIRERAGSGDIRTYIGNSFVKQRLASIQQAEPSFVSAKMLLIQASGNRPVWVSRKVLAAEILRALEPMDWIASWEDLYPGSKDLAKVADTYSSCRSRLDGIDRYAEKDDRDLLDQARELTLALRSLERAARPKSDEYEVWDSLQSARVSFRRLQAPLIKKLVDETSDRSNTTGP